MKLYEIGIVPAITKALNMHINNPHNTWEARQLFLLTNNLCKKGKWPARHPPGPACTAQGKLCRTSDGAPPDSVWLCARG